MNSVIRQLTVRDNCRPDSAEWEIHNRTAWRLFISATGGLHYGSVAPMSVAMIPSSYE